MAVVGAKGKFPGPQDPGDHVPGRQKLVCDEDQKMSAVILTSLGSMGVMANLALIAIILIKRPLRRWSQGLIFHQALVDCARAGILLPMGNSIFLCEAISKCSLVETTFLLLVTVSTVNLLTTVLNDAPILPEDDEEETMSLLKDSPQCVAFGLFMIWFSSITINLGPTFLSGALAANADAHTHEPSCPLVQGPYRHYILNALWILINLLCIMLTLHQLRRLYRDFTTKNIEAVRIAGLFTSMLNIQTSEKEAVPPPSKIGVYIERMEREGVARVKMFLVITVAYLIFWGPLFLVTLFNWSWEWKDAKKSMSHEVSLHVAFVHSFVNPLLFIVLHKGCRKATLDLLCCNFSSPQDDPLLSTPGHYPEPGASQTEMGFGDNMDNMDKPDSRSYM